jgi:magnesium transporter
MDNKTALQPRLHELVRAKQWNELREALIGFDPSDTAELLQALTNEDDVAIFRILPRDFAAQVFSQCSRRRLAAASECHG